MNKLTLAIIAILGFSMILSKEKFLLTEDEHIFEQFQTFISTFNKEYATPEEMKIRFEIFKNNYLKVDLHEQMKEKSGENDSIMGITQFFDLTPEEFQKKYLTLDLDVVRQVKVLYADNKMVPHYRNGAAPESFDWREQGVVSDVKNQGSCGSCWAFSAIGNIEAKNAIKTGKVTNFSEQQLVDCDKVDQGCNGGLMEDAYKYLLTSGVMTQADYPYTGKGGQCKAQADKAAIQVTGFHYAGTEDEEVIKQLLFENGPFAIAVNATPFQFYFGGIFNPWKILCNPKSINHGVLLVGYGTEKNKDYWIVKNSWGSRWGEKGYIKVIRGKGACGINTYVISADL